MKSPLDTTLNPCYNRPITTKEMFVCQSTLNPLVIIAPDRAIGCHGKCQAYADYRAKADEAKAKRAELKRKEDMVNGCLNGMTKMRLYGGW